MFGATGSRAFAQPSSTSSSRGRAAVVMGFTAIGERPPLLSFREELVKAWAVLGAIGIQQATDDSAPARARGAHQCTLCVPLWITAFRHAGAGRSARSRRLRGRR